jgi:polysaccharide biosynthesis protein PslH
VRMTSLLFVSPVVPSPTGGGLRMRAWQFLLGMARGHRVTLVAGSPNFPAEELQSLAHLASLVEDVVILSWRASRDWELALRTFRRLALPGEPARPADWSEPTAAMRRRLARLARRSFGHVHVFRLYMLPIALAILDGDQHALTQLDLDDWESETRRLIATLPSRAARRWRVEAQVYAALEEAWLPRLRRVLVCCEEDRTRLQERYSLEDVRTIRNAIAVPKAPCLPPPGIEPALLFIGSLGYYPNEDAVGFFVTEILPKLRHVHPNLRLLVVGAGAPLALRRLLAAAPGVRWLGRVEQVDDCYRQATAAVVPVRAGGGTRLKVIEAFARARPVISTSIGVAGLALEAGVHFLRADTPDEWVAQSLLLLSDSVLSARLALAAFGRAKEYSLENSIENIAGLFE